MPSPEQMEGYFANAPEMAPLHEEVQKMVASLPAASIADVLTPPDERPRFRIPPTLYVLCGLPRSGKSTWARHRVEPGTDCAPIVSPDAVRIALHGESFIHRAEPFVWATAQTMVRALFEAGHTSVVLDACNVTQERRRMWEDPEWSTQFVHITTPPEVCLQRAQDEGNTKIVGVIARMASSWEPFREGQQVSCYRMDGNSIRQVVAPHWEVIPDADNAERPHDAMWRVRWSEGDAEGRYLWAAHYPRQHMAESQAEQWNKEGKQPWEFHSYRAERSASHTGE